MAAQTPICDFGWKAPAFELSDAAGRLFTLDDCRGPNGVLVMFICNHCPYVRSIIGRLVETVGLLRETGVGTVAINANDWISYPEDAPAKMLEFASQHAFTFPYLLDESQEIARAYDAVCTPDFFGFNADLELQYRGRLDESRTQLVPEAKPELLNAMKQVALTGKGPQEQVPSMGCSIKWRQNT